MAPSSFSDHKICRHQQPPPASRPLCTRERGRDVCLRYEQDPRERCGSAAAHRSNATRLRYAVSFDTFFSSLLQRLSSATIEVFLPSFTSLSLSQLITHRSSWFNRRPVFLPACRPALVPLFSVFLPSCSRSTLPSVFLPSRSSLL